MIDFLRAGIVFGFVLALWPSPGAADERRARRWSTSSAAPAPTTWAASSKRPRSTKRRTRPRRARPSSITSARPIGGAGEQQKALNAYRSYLRNANDAPNREEVRGFIEALKHTIEAEKATKEKPPVGPIPAAERPRPVAHTPVPVRRRRRRDAAAAAQPGPISTSWRSAQAAPRRHRRRRRRRRVAGRRRRLRRADREHQPPAQHPVGPDRRLRQVAGQRGRTYQALETAFFVVGGAARSRPPWPRSSSALGRSSATTTPFHRSSVPTRPAPPSA